MAFTHPPLDQTRRQIRLLKINSPSLESIVSCTLKTYDIADTNSYTALSYTWGPPPADRRIFINGSEFLIRDNLYEFLLIAQDQYSNTLFWIDQICIDQENILERNDQVQLMRDIYRDAHSVIAWLGLAADDSDIAMDFIPIAPPSNSSQHKWTLAFTAPRQKALTALFARPYWSRLWIIQEIKSSPHVVFQCGACTISYSRFAHFVQKIVERRRRSFTRMLKNPDCLVGEFVMKSNARILFLSKVPNKMVITNPMSTYDSGPIPVPLHGHNEISERVLIASVYRYCHFVCSDPRDKVYGLLGMLPRSKHDPKAHDNHGILVRYDKSIIDVFWDFFHIVIRRYKPSGVLRFPKEHIARHWIKFGLKLMSEMEIKSDANILALRELIKTTLNVNLKD